MAENKWEFFRTIEEIRDQAGLITDWLLSQRLQNYGYDWRDFRNLSNRKSRLARKIKQGQAKFESWYGIYSRLEYQKDASGKVVALGYCTGQSQNEEVITLMECILS